MALIDWPEEFPQKMLVEGYSGGAADPRLRSNMSYGPAKVRPRTSSEPWPLRGKMWFRPSQFDAFKIFCRDTLSNCTYRFNLIHPEIYTGTIGSTFTYTFSGTIEVRFVTVPTWVPSRTGLDWVVSLDLEVMP